MKISDWQDGVPPSEGIWEIDVPENKCTYYCRFKDGKWGVGNATPVRTAKYWFLLINFRPYPPNNDPNNPRKWRGVIDE